MNLQSVIRCWYNGKLFYFDTYDLFCRELLYSLQFSVRLVLHVKTDTVKAANVITLGQTKSDNINRMITLTDDKK